MQNVAPLLRDHLVPRSRSAITGAAMGFVMCLPFVLVGWYFVYPTVLPIVRPILRAELGRGEFVGPPWNQVIRAPWWRSRDEACWQIGLYKIYNARPLVTSFYAQTGIGDVPLRVDITDDDMGRRESRTFLIDHVAGQKWIDTYCTQVSRSDLTSDGLHVRGHYTYDFRPWQIVQELPRVHVPPPAE